MRVPLAIGLLAALPGFLSAQGRTVPEALRPFVSVSADVIALTHARVVDGTGAPARVDQTVIVQGDRIAAVGPANAIAIPPGAETIDLSGHTLLPGFVGLHEHTY